uniref:Uncharacterized protein n=1 Tax=Kitasatospora sp. NRRL F-6133 TaxID=1415539 RepID=U5YRV7_9ACTN|nr:hypothetical protein [Kitasatospora sp. NRRL F-6133]
MPEHELPPAALDTVLVMARREAASHLLRPPPGGRMNRPRPVLLVQVARCPWCGAGADTARHGQVVPLRMAPLVDAARPVEPEEGQVRLTALGCESLTARSLLSVVHAATGPGGPARTAYRTRAVAWAELAGPAGVPDLDPRTAADLLRRLADTERWADGAPMPPDAVRTVPASTRPATNPATSADAVEALRRAARTHFLTPHLDGGLASGLNARYRKQLDRAVLAAL